MKQTISYEIKDIDYYENDGYLHIGGKKYYFQWDAINPPTITDVLDFLNAKNVEHKVTVKVVGMTDQAFCSCGWKSLTYFDGREWALEEFRKHEKQVLQKVSGTKEKSLGS